MTRKSSARPVPGSVLPTNNPTTSTRPSSRAPLPTPPRATYAQRAAPNAALLRPTAWHFDAKASSVPITFALSPVIPPPAPVNPAATRFDLATARAILADPEPPATTDADVKAAASSRRRLAQVLVDNIGAGVLLCPHTGKVLLPTPGSCAAILQFAPYNCCHL